MSTRFLLISALSLKRPVRFGSVRFQVETVRLLRFGSYSPVPPVPVPTSSGSNRFRFQPVPVPTSAFYLHLDLYRFLGVRPNVFFGLDTRLLDYQMARSVGEGRPDGLGMGHVKRQRAEYCWRVVMIKAD